MNDKPKDRTTMWMSIIAFILVLISTLGVMIYVIVTGEDGIGALFCLLCLVLLAVALHRKAIGGVFLMIMGLLFVYFEVETIPTGGYVTFSEVIFGFVWGGLLPFCVYYLCFSRTAKSSVERQNRV